MKYFTKKAMFGINTATGKKAVQALNTAYKDLASKKNFYNEVSRAFQKAENPKLRTRYLKQKLLTKREIVQKESLYNKLYNDFMNNYTIKRYARPENNPNKIIFKNKVWKKIT